MNKLNKQLKKEAKANSKLRRLQHNSSRRIKVLIRRCLQAEMRTSDIIRAVADVHDLTRRRL